MTYVGLRTDFKVNDRNRNKTNKYKSKRRKVQKSTEKYKIQNGIRKECG